MVIPGIAAVVAGRPIAATSRVRAVKRRSDMGETILEIEDPEGLVTRRGVLQNASEPPAIGAGLTPEFRASAAVRDQLSKLKLGG